MNEINPKKKSKAFIITFVTVLVILIIGYFMFPSKLNTKTKSDVKGNIFTSLFGTSKQKKIAPIDDTIDINRTIIDTNKDGVDDNTSYVYNDIKNPTNRVSTGKTWWQKINPFPKPNYETCYDKIQNQNETGVDVGGVCGDKKIYETCYDKIQNQNETGVDVGGVCGNPNSKTECNDNKDNDGDGKIDILDPSCHSDFNSTNTSSYNSSLDDESKVELFQCPNDPLEFTDEERAELTKLTREFYKISATLHTADDINAEYTTRKSFIDLTQNAENLTRQCITETRTTYPTYYKGPTARRKNPYMSDNTEYMKKYSFSLPKTISHYVSGINIFDKEAPLQSLYEIVQNISNIKTSTLTSADQTILNFIIKNALGPSYEQGESLPKSDFKKLWEAGTTAKKDIIKSEREAIWRFVYAPTYKPERSTHFNSCEGYIDYEANAYRLKDAKTMDFRILKGLNDAESYLTPVIGKLKMVFGNNELTIGDFDIDPVAAIHANLYFNALYGHIMSLDENLGDNDTENGKQVFDTFNMTNQNQRACNDIYGLKLLLNKTSDMSIIKSYLTQTICYPDNALGIKTCSVNGIDAAKNAGYTDIGFDWIGTLNRIFEDFEEQFRIW